MRYETLQIIPAKLIRQNFKLGEVFVFFRILSQPYRSPIIIDLKWFNSFGKY